MVKECTPSHTTEQEYSDVVGEGILDYEAACRTENDDYLVWTRPTDAGCDAWYRA